MKIEKKKVVKSSRLSVFTKSAVAAALGIAASISATACDDSVSATGGDHPKQPETEPTCGQAACGEQYSSSSYTDISSSGERLSSEAIEALSSAKQPLSSSSMVFPPPESGSPMADLSSSSYEPPPEAGILPPYEESSSSETQSSSSEAKSSSSKTEVPDPRITPVIDTLSPRIHLCEDPNDPRCLIESMVTTFEQDDIQA
ncbi:hypothetical protein [Fibrobacter sp.]|uniref:hypothetical protein n=1 Tax=Fibrobacter sp. TaxID=35828 RepID=UPI003867508B